MVTPTRADPTPEPPLDLVPLPGGVTASLLAGLATGVGALPALLLRNPSARVLDGLLGFAAGIMLAASFIALVLPGIAEANRQWGGPLAGTAAAAVAVLAGAASLWLLERATPHLHFSDAPDSARGPMLPLIAVAIALHNVPEGLAVGVGYGAGDSSGDAVALAIGIQNMPEGLAVAVSLLALGWGRLVSVGVALLTGLVEPLGAALGVAAVGAAAGLLPLALCFAGGAMLFVVSHEVIPETHRKGHEDVATSGLMVGLAAMLLIDAAVGG